MTDAPNYTCYWCKHAFDAASSSCPACGAPVDVRRAVTKSGWSELPGIKDMARIQFGQSFCQIEGNFVPVADFKLAAGDGIYFAHHLLLWKDDRVQISTMSLKSGWKRLFAGMPLVMTQAGGPGRIAFSKDRPGELIAIPLNRGLSIDVREHVFMIATHSVDYDWFNTGIWYRTREDKNVETHYPIGMFMDRFGASNKEGLLLLHGAGNAFVRDLERGQSILIKPTALLFKDTIVQMNLHFEYPRGVWNPYGSWGVGTTWSNRHVWLRLTGPGRVGVQSNFDNIEDRGQRLVDFEANSTEARW
jgi:uncharacterized protein (AIM24 family)